MTIRFYCNPVNWGATQLAAIKATSPFVSTLFLRTVQHTNLLLRHIWREEFNCTLQSKNFKSLEPPVKPAFFLATKVTRKKLQKIAKLFDKRFETTVQCFWLLTCSLSSVEISWNSLTVTIGSRISSSEFNIRYVNLFKSWWKQGRTSSLVKEP